MKNTYSSRLQAVRNKMAKLNLDAFIVPHEDQYLLEEVAEYNNRLKWLSGFTGTAGVVVILKNREIMFVDGRYQVQVAEQVNNALFEFECLSTFSSNDWADKLLPSEVLIGVDCKLHAFSWYKKFTQALSKSGKYCLTVEENLIDLCWIERPSKNIKPITFLQEKYHGKSSKLKIKQVAQRLKSNNVNNAIITNLDSICWLLNLRGRDIPCLPVFYATAIISENSEVLCFLDLKKLPKDITIQFEPSVSFRCESELDSYLAAISSERIQIDPETINAAMVNLLIKDDVEIIENLDPVSLLKSEKNAVEIAGFKNCHLRDGSAVVAFLAWLEQTTSALVFYDEKVLSDRLESMRLKDSLYQEASFETVSAVGSNAAMCHYNHKDTTPALMTNNSVYLFDSGGHYLDGTTDVTRTVAIGQVTNEQIKMATLVLKGHIALATLKFPQGTTGQHIDALARQHLWQHGYDYAHGTGHGVGHYLNVHEGPQRIAKFNSGVALAAGMVVSIEPGYYREGEFGIRHENLYMIKESEMPVGAEVKTLQFEVLTHVPFDRKLIDKTMLSEQEINWLNQYHHRVYHHIASLSNETNKAWLAKATMPF